MKTYIPLDRLKRSRDSGYALYNMHPTDVLGRAGGVFWGVFCFRVLRAHRTYRTHRTHQTHLLSDLSDSSDLSDFNLLTR